MMRLKILRRISLILISSIFFYACNSNTQVVEPSVSQSEKITMKNPVIKREAKIFRKEIRYNVDSLKTKSNIDSLFNSYSEDQLNTILALNRIEKK